MRYRLEITESLFYNTCKEITKLIVRQNHNPSWVRGHVQWMGSPNSWLRWNAIRTSFTILHTMLCVNLIGNACGAPWSKRHKVCFFKFIWKIGLGFSFQVPQEKRFQVRITHVSCYQLHQTMTTIFRLTYEYLQDIQ